MSRQFNELVASIVRALPAPDEIVPHLAQVLIDGPSELRAKFDAALARAVREIFIPVITVTGTEELQFPDWIDRVEKDAVGPVGTLELEFIELLENSRDSISSDEMLSRAASARADLGLRHGLAFIAKYRNEGFGLPTGTYIPLSGTVVVHAAGDRHVPYLSWGGRSWLLLWRWLAHDWLRLARLVRPRSASSGPSVK
ncbi:MAG: hypothetical protein A2653_02225 [Candidatus Zambryskibacteria bacterium RIFCSPHIGHO2_01_FULL_43_25]|uniref:Uncharacterized protein n=1 Tax=Candidatus Zambryskibacteria bacterium RIFCSPLOWO2_01_FULL_45_21 TaxID=1802761 RepID=A0A1G2U345_9BACT|nr:MAG: hypothetical protein A2653_02225 [Candidatus Zambryskibacteria bacterium RIFCSPHIGHO2_01_FULL_43_25]OHB01018.1 MAG: hypothetical protein A3E94_02405 [Candidatus Zambryskibacteria bacterium RIFCSPHIGHO2_12_FULL_44_12b]OHB03937.1 MAG: hypothetical protein A3B14_01225 [Candidatus Zambryskibacteria bacterium RIFCSPLOWO2_01_FULL_45_21]